MNEIDGAARGPIVDELFDAIEVVIDGGVPSPAIARLRAAYNAVIEHAYIRAHVHEWRLDVIAGTRYCGGASGCGEVEPTGNPTSVDADAWLASVMRDAE